MYFKIARKTSSMYRYLTSYKQVEEEALSVLKKVNKTEEINRVIKYIECAYQEAIKAGSHAPYLYLMDKENLEKEIIAPLKKSAGWTDADDVIVDKIIPQFLIQIDGDWDEQRKKIIGHGHKIAKWLKAGGIAAGLIGTGYGIARFAHYVKNKNAKK